ncbi:WD repeat-containing protein 62 [Larimichthys crocea]|uniref:WD repeat-containing protein 62 n=1 Tax=Larimichthys crocea TaxID=215358 RepID=A0A6G0ITI0_LARCR|nr:WD repeat-containing protein 62 [Larimichthys crocea]
MAGSTYCITSSSLLCLFNSSRQLEAWVNLKTSLASCLAVSENFIFCGCADGVSSECSVHPTCSTPRQRCTPTTPAGRRPHQQSVTCQSRLGNVVKLYSALYHSGSVWSVEVYPELSDVSQACLPLSSFFTCSSDNTIRLWHADPPTGHRNLYSNNTQHLQAEGESADGKAGIRVLGISPMDDTWQPETDVETCSVKLLASASRDRLIHIFNLEKNYSLEQTLNDHSASITAVKFTGESPEVRMVSCGADKSIYFQSAEQTADGLSFSRSHHVVEKTTLYDMDLDSSRTHVAIACQDRNGLQRGDWKLKKCLKGSSMMRSSAEDPMDPSGSFFAPAAPIKNITIFDYESGECVATLFGHSVKIVTCMRFSQDCRHLITVSGDSCVFVWRLDPQMTSTMRKRRGLKLAAAPETCSRKQPNIRRETFITVPSSQLPHMEEEEEEEELDLRTPARLDLGQGEEEDEEEEDWAQVTDSDPPPLQTNGKLPMWFRKLQGQGEASTSVQSGAEPRQVRSRWAEQLDPLIICANFSPSQMEEDEEEEQEEEEDFHPQSLESLLEVEEDEDGEEEKEVLQNPGEDRSTFILYPNTANTTTDREFDIEGVTDPQKTQVEVRGQGAGPVWSTQLSPDSACSEGSAGSVEQQHDPVRQLCGSLCLEDDEDRNSLKSHFDTLASSLSDEKFDTDPRTLQPPEKTLPEPPTQHLHPLLSRFQDKIKAWPAELRLLSQSQPGSQRRASSATHHASSRNLPARSSVASTVQQAPPRLGYLGTTASSRAKLSQDSTSTQEEEEKENLPSSSSDLHLLSAGLDFQGNTPELHEDQIRSVPQVLATPTEVMSLSEGSRWSVSSVDEMLTSQNQTVIQSPAPSITPTGTPTVCDIITCSTSTRGESPGGSETRIQTDPDPSADLPSSSSSPLLKTLRPLQTGSGDVDESVSLLQCQAVADELKQTARRAAHLYQQLGASVESSDRRLQMSSVLQEAFDVVNSELQAVRRGSGGGGSAPSGPLEDDRTMSLLEKYSEQLVQMTQNKLNRI